MHRLGTGDSCVCAEARSADSKCTSSCNSIQRFPEGKHQQAYVEGVGVDGAFLASRGTSGFEGLRLLSREFSLCSRAEASFFRTEFLGKTYKASAGVAQVSSYARSSRIVKVSQNDRNSSCNCVQSWIGSANK